MISGSHKISNVYELRGCFNPIEMWVCYTYSGVLCLVYEWRVGVCTVWSCVRDAAEWGVYVTRVCMPVTGHAFVCSCLCA